MSDLSVSSLENSVAAALIPGPVASSPSASSSSPVGIAPQNPFDNDASQNPPQNPFEGDVHTARSGDTHESDGFPAAKKAEEEIVPPASPKPDEYEYATGDFSASQRDGAILAIPSAPSTPDQKLSHEIPQSAPPALVSSPAPMTPIELSLPSYPATDRRPISSENDFSRPTQPIFDDDHTEPSSAATGNTCDATHAEPANDDDADKEESNISKLLRYTKRRIGQRNESDDEDDIVDGAVISGYLDKLGRNGKWQSRWFETDGECLSYYKSRKRSKLLATLDLEKVGNIIIDENDSKGCSFTIQVLGRLYYLRAENQEACRDWVITLNRVKEARLQQGNVKLVDPGFQPIDLLDVAHDTTAPRVVLVANRERTRAVNADQDWDRLLVPNGDDPARDQDKDYSESNRISTLSTVVLARWSKRKTTLTRLRAKLAQWARSVRKFGCMNGDSVVQLDRHVHPPGHDFHKSASGTSLASNSKPKTGVSNVLKVGSVVASPRKSAKLNRETSSASDESAARYLS